MRHEKNLNYRHGIANVTYKGFKKYRHEIYEKFKNYIEQETN